MSNHTQEVQKEIDNRFRLLKLLGGGGSANKFLGFDGYGNVVVKTGPSAPATSSGISRTEYNNLNTRVTTNATNITNLKTYAVTTNGYYWRSIKSDVNTLKSDVNTLKGDDTLKNGVNAFIQKYNKLLDELKGKSILTSRTASSLRADKL